ncbi:fibrinogen-like protein 1 [Patella vulgata]|uniref:fibrinogen-like protein 1 n=1 Tax=Patella vulgata TaxID=6465 RepID=UPI0021808500|nr:fibrinogen-like protein 1 [Patella vulgata]
MKNAIVLYFTCLAIYDGVSVQLASYSKTSVTFIANLCMDDSLLTRTASNRIQCGLLCSGHSDCRRFLFCPVSLVCTLYPDGTDCPTEQDTTSCSCYMKTSGYDGSDYTCPFGFYGNGCQQVVTDCADGISKDVFTNTEGKERLTYIKPATAAKPFEVYCETQDPGSIIVLERNIDCSSESFNRSLVDYELGFGIVRENSWIGFNRLLAVLNSSPDYKFALRVRLWYNEGECITEYEGFNIGNKETGYKLIMESYTSVAGSSPCGDSLMDDLAVVGYSFTTYDVDYTNTNRCGQKIGAGWWFASHPSCARSYLTGSMDGTESGGLWADNLEGYILKRVVVTVRKIV